MSAALQGPNGLVQLGNEVVTIGRSRQNRLVFTHSQVSSKHAEIQPRGDGRYQIIDVGSSNGTSVNGVRLSAGMPYILNDGDRVRLGGVGGIELTYTWSAAPAVQPVAPLPQPVTTTDPAWGAQPLAGAQAYPPVQAPPAPAPPVGYAPPGWREVPAPAPAPAPAPLPAAISSPARYTRPPKALLVGGAALLLVLVIAGIGLGAGLVGGKPSSPASNASSAPPVVKTGQATLEGQDTTVLTNAQGLTLYYFKPDTSTKTACTGDCIAKWPPLLFDGQGNPTAATDLPGTLSIQESENGKQVAYNGHPLYTFSGDTEPGQANGQGKAGKWFVVTPDLEANASAPPVIQTAQATVEDQEVTILTNAQGLTLYYFTPDTAAESACTGDCAATWPPLLFDGEGNPTAVVDLPGTLGIQENANGKQVTYNGHPLYTFSGDSEPGQTNGQGKAGKWFVVTPDLEPVN